MRFGTIPLTGYNTVPSEGKDSCNFSRRRPGVNSILPLFSYFYSLLIFFSPSPDELRSADTFVRSDAGIRNTSEFFTQRPFLMVLPGWLVGRRLFVHLPSWCVMHVCFRILRFAGRTGISGSRCHTRVVKLAIPSYKF